MKTELNLHVYLGTTRGALAYTQCNTTVKSKYDLQDLSEEVTSLSWGRLDNEVLIGYKDGQVKFYNTDEEKYTKSIGDEIEGEGAVAGLELYKNGIIIGRQNGLVNFWNPKCNDSLSLNLEDGSTLESMVYNSSRNVVGTGGVKNDLKLWDVEKQTAVFKAKSLGHDELNLPLPTTIRGICFFPTEENLVATATKEGNVLLYDDRAQRKPVGKYFETKASYTCIATSYRDRQCFVGTTKGYMQLIDMRHCKCVKTFKSFTGGITSIVCDPNEPYVASACLDRHVRIHNLETKELLYKEYMKMGLSKLIMKPIIKAEPEEKQEANVSDEEYDELFENMETIEDGKKNKKRRVTTKTKSNKKVKLKKSE